MYSSGHLRYVKADRPTKIHYYAYYVQAGIAEISVDRLDHAPLADAVAIAEKNAAAREQKFYGWAVITKQDAAINGRWVKASPKPDNNPYHADIVLPDFAAKNRDQQKNHALELAASSSWRACPPARERR